MDTYTSWLEERQSAWLYRVVARHETEARLKSLLEALASAAEQQALIWEQQMGDIQKPPAELPISLRMRIVAWLVGRLGARAVKPILAAMKVRGLSVYHASGSGAHTMPHSIEEVGRHHQNLGEGGRLRAAVFGVNDGLVSNTGLIMGVAAASGESLAVITAGIAGGVAGAISMAAGEYVSMRAQRELYEYQIGLERDELNTYPTEEQEELALIYNARGLPMASAREAAANTMQDADKALDTLAREELGINPDDLGLPWGAAAASFLAFSLGALLPLLPFLLADMATALKASIFAAGMGLFSVGLLISLFTGRSALLSGLRMLLIGGGAGVTTYAIGHLIGTSLG